MHPHGGPDLPETPPALALRRLVKRFDRTVAVDGLELDVPTGSFFGLVGPNGAGKTTTLSMTTGLIRPDAGTACVLGHDVWDDPITAKRLLGILPDNLTLFDRLTGAQLLEYIGRLHDLDRELARQRARELLDVLDLSDAADTLVVDYSAGMTKKIGLACALIHGPRILILDEPFESVDPVSAATIRSILRTFAAGGGTVVISSHVMTLVEQLCDHVAIIARGRVLASGPIDEVRHDDSLEDRFVRLVGGHRELGEELAWLRSSRP
ncbi:ABC transporter ATP-binding protein [Actinobacteria bacterium YIM 96077]|uniref:ABC transporter ATP-binding protein n=1 Tax=Phytoactinopolyspora halophila TaxID=1981511 RepID=A0A329QW82_9ACTN|nr:ABC transporter ATP-binding protein [Actinobacteria bacterium YIM 96077]RAW16517.1 ABC transporter ATP-binding protein [Phytoactinopolyspora halophila]